MTRIEYVIALTEAKRSAIVNRWTPLVNGVDRYDVAECSFCGLTKGYGCWICLIHEEKKWCCREWVAFYGTEETDNHTAALAMLARIEAVDVEAWADHLVEKGVLRDE